jgi:hypothetical protein
MPTPRRRRHETAASPTALSQAAILDTADAAATEGRRTAGTPAHPAHVEIARRAYEIFLARGGDNGADLADWLQAEAELRQSMDAASRPSEPASRRRAAGGRRAGA